MNTRANPPTQTVTPVADSSSRRTRVGTRDREQVVAQLQQHYVEGRLSSLELSERIEQALAARTRADLDAILADLPALLADPAPAQPARPDERRRAGRHGEKSLRAHATSYLLVMALLVTIWLLTTPGGYFWPIWPMLGWGIGLASHALGARGMGVCGSRRRLHAA